MKKSAYASLASLVLLLVLVVVVGLLSSRKQNNAVGNPNSPSSPQATSQNSRGANASSPSADKNKNPTSTARKSSPSTRAGTPQAKAIATAQNPRNQQLLKKRLARTETVLTREEIPGGGELIHLNGSQAHFAAATIAPDGSIQTQCHSSYEGLVNPTPLPEEPEEETQTLTK